ncbi:MAG: GNAT family N-acetyltransferase [Dysgonomonas sp.]
MLIIRPIIDKDQTILREATYYNLNWDEDRFSFEDIDSNPKFSHYYKWEKTDFGFIAQSHQQISGIVWIKYFTEQDPGFGFWDEETPELSLCVFPLFRNSGLGSRLLQMAIDDSKKREIPSLSLSVEFENEIARNLYEKFGFRYIDGTDGCMLLEFL